MAKVGYYYSKSVRDLFLDPDARFIMGASGGGGGAVSTVFGRTGAVVAATNDYTFAQIGSKPTTLSGYGITDGLSTSRTISTTSPITGGGDLSANRTIAWDFSVANTWTGKQTYSGTAQNQIVLTNSGLGEATNVYNPGGGAAGYAAFQLYPVSGPSGNAAMNVSIIPRGTGQSGNKSGFSIFGTDFVAGQTNYEYFTVTATGLAYTLQGLKAGTGSYRDVIMSANGSVSQFILKNTGTVLVNTATDNGNTFQVSGTMSVSSSVGIGGVALLSGGVQPNISLQSGGTYTILAADYTIVFTGTTATWTLPVSGTGKMFVLVNHGTGSVTTSVAYTTANGTTTTTLAAGARATIQYDGTVWRQIAA